MFSQGHEPLSQDHKDATFSYEQWNARMEVWGEPYRSHPFDFFDANEELPPEALTALETLQEGETLIFTPGTSGRCRVTFLERYQNA